MTCIASALTLGGQQVGLSVRVAHLVDGRIRLKRLVHCSLAAAHDHPQRCWVSDQHHIVPQELEAVDATKPAWKENNAQQAWTDAG
jgi:hypothetical protein